MEEQRAEEAALLATLRRHDDEAEWAVAGLYSRYRVYGLGRRLLGDDGLVEGQRTRRGPSLEVDGHVARDREDEGLRRAARRVEEPPAPPEPHGGLQDELLGEDLSREGIAARLGARSARSRPACS